MEEQSNQENTEGHLIPMPKLFIASRNGSHWTYLPKPSHYLPHTSTEYMMGSSYHLPVANINDGNNGAYGTNRSFLYDDPGKVYAFKPIGSSSNDHDFDIRKHLGFWKADEVIKADNGSGQSLLYAESLVSWTKDSVGEKHNASQNPTGMVGSSALLPKPVCSSSKQKARVSDRACFSIYRQRIADNLKALHELLPNPAERCQAYVLDNIIDYIKYLQLQIKGNGHYINQQMLNEPLEEIMGKLLEENSAAASQLLETKGLFLLPMALVDELSEAMQLFGGSALI